MTDELENISFEYTPPPPVEFRLYYDENGKVLFYTCDKPEGNFILVDAMTFAEARQDVRVVDGEVKRVSNNITIPKLKIGLTGTRTLKEDISIVSEEKTNQTQLWELTEYELK